MLEAAEAEWLLLSSQQLSINCLVMSGTINYGTSLVAQTVKNLPAMQETQVQSLGWEDPLEKGMATHSSILAWKFHGQRSLMGYSPWDHKGLDTTEQLIDFLIKSNLSDMSIAIPLSCCFHSHYYLSPSLDFQSLSFLKYI